MITFRLFEVRDIPVITSMMREFNAIDNYPFDEEQREHNLRMLIANPAYGKLWLIEMPEDVAGYTFLGYGFSFEFKGRDAFVDELFIVPAFRGKGIGKKAIDFIVEQAKLEGIKALHLEAEVHNKNALNLYRNKGFVDHKRFLLTKWL